jgi:hypothetical protein
MENRHRSGGRGQCNLYLRRCDKKYIGDISVSAPVNAELSGIAGPGNQRKNAENILTMKEIPGNNQITRLLDEVAPEGFVENSKRVYNRRKHTGFWTSTRYWRARY